MMIPANRQRQLARWVALAGFAWLLVSQFLAIRQLGDDLARKHDSFSEAGTLRAAESYAVRGFTRDHGLPHIAYGRQFPHDGWASMHPDEREGIYTHYPPGADWLAGLGMTVLGVRHVGPIRWLPVGFGVCALAFLTHRLWRRFGPQRTAFFVLAVVSTPVVRGWLHTLYYQGYAMALMWIQLALLLDVFSTQGALRSRLGWALFALGFAQGWLSFDYFFLTALAAWPCWSLLPAESRARRRRELWLTVALPAVGVASAHLLHFLQVSAHFGGVRPALHDMFHAAGERASTSVSAAAIAFGYVKGLLVGPDLFGYRFSALALLTGGLLLWRRVWLRLRASRPSDWTGLWAAAGAPVAALVVCLLWTVAMKQHAMIHYFFLNCHLLLVYEMLLLVASLELWPPEDEAAT